MSDKKDKKKESEKKVSKMSSSTQSSSKTKASDKSSSSTKPSSSGYSRLLLSARDKPPVQPSSKTKSKSTLDERTLLLSSRDKASTVKASSQQKSTSQQTPSLQHKPISQEKITTKTSESCSKRPKIEPNMKSRPPPGTKSILRTKEDEKFASKQEKYSSLSASDKKIQEDWAQRKLQGTAACPQGFTWDRIEEQRGYQCRGGTHFVTDKLLAERKGGVLFRQIRADNGEFRWTPPYYADPKKPGRYVYGGPLRDGKHPWEEALAIWIDGRAEMAEIKIEGGKIDPALKEYLAKNGTMVGQVQVGQVQTAQMQVTQRMEVNIEGSSMDPEALKEFLAKHGAKVSTGTQKVKIKVEKGTMDEATMKGLLAKFGTNTSKMKKK